MTTETKLYGVSFGNGNDGVSQLYPCFWVHTGNPWELARVALADRFNASFVAWAKDAMITNGEAEYTITAMLPEGPHGETEFGAAYMLCEVFPSDAADADEYSMIYPSTEAAIGADTLGVFRKAQHD